MAWVKAGNIKGPQGPAGDPGPTVPATADTIGAVKPGTGIKVDSAGAISPDLKPDADFIKFVTQD